MKLNEQQEKILRETKELVELFLKTNASDIELSKITGISSSTVGRRLTNEENIKKAFLENGAELYQQIKTQRHTNLLKGKALGGQTTLMNHVFVKDEDGKFEGATKLRMDVISQKEDTVYRILMHAALTFKVHPDTLSSLFQVDEKIIYENLINIAGTCYDALMFLFYHDAYDQEKARVNFLKFYRDLLNATRTKNVNERKAVISSVTDIQAAEFKKKRINPLIPLTDEEILVLIRYQVKYSLKAKDVANIFNINRSNYLSRIPKVLELDEELRSQYEYLADFYKTAFLTRNSRRG